MSAKLERLPFGPDAMKAIQFAVEEAEAFSHARLGRYHVFIGLIRQSHMVPGMPFNEFPDLIPNLREEAVETYASMDRGPRVFAPMGSVKLIMENAQQLARKERQLIVSADHLLRATLAQEQFDEKFTQGSRVQQAGVLQSVGLSAYHFVDNDISIN